MIPLELIERNYLESLKVIKENSGLTTSIKEILPISLSITSLNYFNEFQLSNVGYRVASVMFHDDGI